MSEQTYTVYLVEADGTKWPQADGRKVEAGAVTPCVARMLADLRDGERIEIQ